MGKDAHFDQKGGRHACFTCKPGLDKSMTQITANKQMSADECST